jgi:serine/threonine protein phosphatase PrpC
VLLCCDGIWQETAIDLNEPPVLLCCDGIWQETANDLNEPPVLLCCDGISPDNALLLMSTNKPQPTYFLKSEELLIYCSDF